MTAGTQPAGSSFLASTGTLCAAPEAAGVVVADSLTGMMAPLAAGDGAATAGTVTTGGAIVVALIGVSAGTVLAALAMAARVCVTAAVVRLGCGGGALLGCVAAALGGAILADTAGAGAGSAACCRGGSLAGATSGCD